MDPQRMAMRDLVQPFGVRRPGMDQGRDAERGEQNSLGTLKVEILPVHVRGDPFGSRVLIPTPVAKRRREELELLRRCREALLQLAVDLDRGGSVTELGEGQPAERFS